MNFTIASDLFYKRVKTNKINDLCYYSNYFYKCAWMKTKDIRDKNPDFVFSVLDELSQYNLSENQKFKILPIIYNHYTTENNSIKESVYDVLYIVKVFDFIKSNLEKQDLSQYKTFSDLRDIVNSTNLELTTKKQQDHNGKKIKEISFQEQEKSIENEDVTKILDNDDVLIYRVNNYTGSKSFGRDTPWCITKSSMYYNRYIGDNLIFYFVENKKLSINNPLSKIAIRAIRDWEGRVTNLKYTSRKNDGDQNDINNLPGINKYQNIIIKDAEQQKLGLVALIKSGKATIEQVQEYWDLLLPTSFKEKEDIIHDLKLNKYGLNDINWFNSLHERSEKELLSYFKTHNDAATAEILCKKTESQKILKELWNSGYPSVMPIISRKTTDFGIMTEAAVSLYNKVKIGLVWNFKAPRIFIEHIKENIQDDGNYNTLEGESLKRDLITVQKRLEYKKDKEDDAMKSPETAYDFAASVPGANIQKLQNAVMDNPEVARNFAKNITGADIEKIQEKSVKNYKDAFLFAKDVPGSNIKKLQDIILISKDTRYIYMFAKLGIFGIDVQSLQKAIEEVCDKNKSYYDFVELLNFVREIPGANVQSAQKYFMIETSLAWLFANIPGANIQDIQLAVFKNGNENDMNNFIREIPGAKSLEEIKQIYNKIEQENKIQEMTEDDAIKKPETALLFAQKNPGANINRLQNAVISFGVSTYIIQFAFTVPSADVKYIAEWLRKNGREEVADFLINDKNT